MLTAHLRSSGVYIQRHRVRAFLRAVDSDGVTSRRSVVTRRRVYQAPCPNYVWHIDGLHKLIRWKLVIHGAIDGYSRLVSFLSCSDNNTAQTVLNLFDGAASLYGLPLRVRTDHGGENSLIWQKMINSTGQVSSVIVGSSVHNERIERMWRDVNHLVTLQFRQEFYGLESEEYLDPDNDTDLFCLHFVYLPIVNRTLEQHRRAHNSHSIRTESNYTRMQLFVASQHLTELHSAHTSAGSLVQYGVGVQELNTEDLPHVAVSMSDIACNLPSTLRDELQTMVPADVMLSEAKQCFLNVVACVGQYLATINAH